MTAGENVNFIFHEKLYTEGMSPRKIKNICSKVKKGSVNPGIFLITLPLMDEGLLEVYWYPEFLQPVYKALDQEVVVVGIAGSREDAFSLIERIVRDVGVSGGKIPLLDYFEVDK